MKNLLILISLIFITSCITQIEKRGYNFELSDYKLVKEGITSQNMILEMMGSPTFISEIENQELWIYFSEDIRKLLFLKPKILDRKILVISFDNSGITDKIDNYNLTNDNKINFAMEYTHVVNNKKSIWSQIFGSIGQIRAN